MELRERIEELVQRFRDNASSLEVEPDVRVLLSQHSLEELLQAFSEVSVQDLPREVRGQLALATNGASPEQVAQSMAEANLSVVRARYQGLEELMIFAFGRRAEVEARTTAFTTLLQFGVAAEEVACQQAIA